MGNTNTGSGLTSITIVPVTVLALLYAMAVIVTNPTLTGLIEIDAPLPTIFAIALFEVDQL